jgi:hypothetical protein
VDVNAQTVLGSINTTLAGIFSISIAGTQVAAGSSNDPRVALIDFSDASNPVVGTFNPGIALGATVFRGSNQVVAGAINGLNIALFNVAGVNASPIATINGGISSIATIALGEFAGSGPPPPPPPVQAAFGPGEITGFGFKVCVPNDTTPEGTVSGGFRKTVTTTPFGKACRWDPVK